MTDPHIPAGMVEGAAIYIAARFSQRPECNALAHALKAQGHTITSRWVKPNEDDVLPTGLSAQAADAERKRFAEEDCADVRACDWLVSIQGEPRSGGRGGRHVEFGYGLALGKRMISIGPRETVFHHLGEVLQFDTVAEFLAWSAKPTPVPQKVAGERETIADTVTAAVEKWLGQQGGFRAYAERVESGATGWSQLRSTIWLAVFDAVLPLLALGSRDAAVLDLLAVIHRDGGHHTEAVGFAQSIQDAMHLSSERIAASEAARDAAIAMREALTKIAEGDEPRPVGKTWNTDGTPSKHDKCIHDVWIYEDCGECVSEFARRALPVALEGEA